MIRKLLLVAAAIAMPVSAGAVALVGTATPAGALGPTVNCAAGGLVTFAAPGISHTGAVTTLLTESTKTGITTLSKGTTASCTGSSPALTIPTATVSVHRSRSAHDQPGVRFRQARLRLLEQLHHQRDVEHPGCDSDAHVQGWDGHLHVEDLSGSGLRLPEEVADRGQ